MEKMVPADAATQTDESEGLREGSRRVQGQCLITSAPFGKVGNRFEMHVVEPVFFSS